MLGVLPVSALACAVTNDISSDAYDADCPSIDVAGHPGVIDARRPPGVSRFRSGMNFERWQIACARTAAAHAEASSVLRGIDKDTRRRMFYKHRSRSYWMDEATECIVWHLRTGEREFAVRNRHLRFICYFVASTSWSLVTDFR